MSSKSSNKPIVFVFGAKKGDADGRKKNLSAINTQVAYRAHERRREKKNRQRAQAQEDGQADEPRPSNDLAVSGIAAASNVDAKPVDADNHLQSSKIETTAGKQAFQAPPQSYNHVLRFSNNRPAQHVFALEKNVNLQVREATRSSDQLSDSSSDREVTSTAIWSASPTSGRHSSPATDLTSTSPVALTPLNGHLQKALDPFFRLPVPATNREQWLVHFYFSEMGHIGFGTHSNSLFCPDRDWVSQYVSSKSLCFQWVLILAEQFLGMIGGMPSETDMIARKAKAYGALGSILKSKVVDRDEGISGIMYAVVVDTARTSMHLMALDRFINNTGGFEAFLDGPLGIAHPDHVMTVYAFGPCPVTSLSDLDTTIFRCTSTLDELHKSKIREDEEKRRIRNRRPWDTLSLQLIDGNGTLVPSNHDDHFRYFVKTQQDCLSSDCVGPLVDAALDTSADYATQARHFAVLVQLLLIMREFDYSYLAKAMFLKRLKYVAETSSGRDPRTHRACLTNAGLLLINSFVRQEVQTHFDRTKNLSQSVSISGTVVHFLKLFPLMQLQTRALVASWLREWLCPDDRFEGTQFQQLQEKDLAAIGAEVRNTWYESTRINS